MNWNSPGKQRARRGVPGQSHQAWGLCLVTKAVRYSAQEGTRAGGGFLNFDDDHVLLHPYGEIRGKN